MHNRHILFNSGIYSNNKFTKYVIPPNVLRNKTQDLQPDITPTKGILVINKKDYQKINEVISESIKTWSLLQQKN